MWSVIAVVSILRICVDTSGDTFQQQYLKQYEDQHLIKLLAQIMFWCSGSLSNSAKITVEVAFLGGYTTDDIKAFANQLLQRNCTIKCVFFGASILEKDVMQAICSRPQIIFFYPNEADNLICS